MPQGRTTPYRGRFAPSPTGPLHFGSLVAAVASYLQARCEGGEWLVRIEDIDPPRERAGAADDILRTLDRYGLHWDGAVWFQSRRREAYLQSLKELERLGAIYPCGCSRREIEASTASQDLAPGIYPGTCRAGLGGRPARMLRVLTRGQVLGFEDRIQGAVRQDLERACGDFVLRRADGLFAYQLAVVVDDAAQGVTDVVRGSDLLDSTPRQILLQRLLGLPQPDYAHLPIATDSGQKLSKQTHAPPLDASDPVPSLWRALEFLGQQPPPELRSADREAFWQWAHAHWRLHRVPRRREIALDHPAGRDPITPG